MNAAVRSVDFVARVAEAWDGGGRHFFMPLERRMLLVRAGLDLSLAMVPWHLLREHHRQALVVAARQGVEFGRACAWCFGEGEGARL